MRRYLPALLLPLALVALVPAWAAGAAPAGPAPDPSFPPAPAASAPVSPVPTSPATRQKPVTSKGLAEPRLRLAKSAPGVVRVALTFDACSGATDQRILSTLIENRVPATIFATARWLRHNPAATALLKANPDLFEVENHGGQHVPAVDHPAMVYGIAAAGSPEAVRAEVQTGADALVAAGFPAPVWFRGATARYNAGAMKEIGAMGYRVAGYSLNGDDGAMAAASVAEKRLAGATDGAVVIAHINQPGHEAGLGVARGILALKARGVTFVRLADAVAEPDAKAAH